MVDIHCHILPALDDGPKSLEDAVEMVNAAAAAGTTDIVATPHANARYNFDPEMVARKIEELRQAAGQALRIHTGCDFNLAANNIQDALAHPRKYAINHLSYLLVEFSDFGIPPGTTAIFSQLRDAGIVPIVTHPERNRLLHERREEIGSWVDNDCLIQVTAQSFFGAFGRTAKAFADELMQCGLVHFVASDGHDTRHRPPVLAEAYSYVENKFGARRAEALFVTNPRATLTGEPVEPLIVARKRKWYDFRRHFQ